MFLATSMLLHVRFVNSQILLDIVVLWHCQCFTLVSCCFSFHSCYISLYCQILSMWSGCPLKNAFVSLWKMHSVCGGLKSLSAFYLRLAALRLTLTRHHWGRLAIWVTVASQCTHTVYTYRHLTTIIIINSALKFGITGHRSKARKIIIIGVIKY